MKSLIFLPYLIGAACVASIPFGKETYIDPKLKAIYDEVMSKPLPRAKPINASDKHLTWVPVPLESLSTGKPGISRIYTLAK
jgi:hypothetical protein